MHSEEQKATILATCSSKSQSTNTTITHKFESFFENFIKANIVSQFHITDRVVCPEEYCQVNKKTRFIPYTTSIFVAFHFRSLLHVIHYLVLCNCLISFFHDFKPG